MNKDLLICFLNSLFNGRQVVKDVSYLNPEHVGDVYTDRKAIFDVYCEGENGEKFIVEMQNVYQEFFKDRTVYYSTFPIREQSKRGEEWDYHLDSVYTVGLLNFVFDEDKDDKDCFHHEVKLMDVVKKTVFYDKLAFIYIEIPKFNKKEDELVTMFDKWMYVLKNLSRLMERPAALQERIFTKLFEQAEIARFNAEDLKEYEDSVNAYRDILNAIKTAERIKYAEGKAEGKAEGLAEGKAMGIEEGKAMGIQEGKAMGIQEGKDLRNLEVAKNLLDMNVPIPAIIKATGISAEDIARLKEGRNSE